MGTGIRGWITLAAQIAAVAQAEASEVAARRTTSVPVNVGIVPYVDVNSHVVRPRNNLSLDAVAGSAWNLDGAGVAGVAGVVRDAVRGLQLTGVAGYVGGDLAGAQIAGVLGATRGAVTGLQLSGVVSYAGQVAGAQLGLVNVGGRVRGLQLGLVNVADEVEGAAIGLVNVVRKEGRQELELWTSNTAAFAVGAKLGTKHFYSLLGLAMQRANDRTSWMPTLGLGGSIALRRRAFLNIEALASIVNRGSEWDYHSVLGQLRVTGGYRVRDRLALFAGPAVSFFRSTTGKRLSDVSYTSTLVTLNEGGVPVDVGLGFVVGVQAF